jgi:hypothetical protein
MEWTIEEFKMLLRGMLLGKSVAEISESMSETRSEKACEAVMNGVRDYLGSGSGRFGNTALSKLMKDHLDNSF